ncbi:hypothetical protein ACI8AF_24680 [Blastococcus sp. SYSU D00669]
MTGATAHDEVTTALEIDVQQIYDRALLRLEVLAVRWRRALADLAAPPAAEPRGRDAA